MAEADLVVTGEGRLDAQTFMGKGPSQVAALGKKYGVPVIGVGGSVTREAEEASKGILKAVFSILREPASLKEALEPERAKENMRRTGEQIFRLIRTFRR